MRFIVGSLYIYAIDQFFRTTNCEVFDGRAGRALVVFGTHILRQSRLNLGLLIIVVHNTTSQKSAA